MAYENFLPPNYTEEDPDSTITVSSTAITHANSKIESKSHVVADKGVDHFDEDFTHQFECLIEDISGAASSLPFWAVANALGSGWLHIYTSTEIAFFYATATLFRLRAYHSGLQDGLDSSAFGAISGTLYFITIIRDDDGGSGNGSFTAYIRTGSHEGTLKDTLVINLASKYNYRYLYGYISQGPGDASTADGFTRNLNINEANDAFVKIMTTLYTGVEKINTAAKSTIAKIFNIPTSV